MKNLRQIISEAVISESVSSLRFPTDRISAETTNNLKQLHNIMRAKGYKKEAYKQSAIEGHRYVKGDHVIEYNGWHGTGPYGSLKMGLDLWDNKVPAADGSTHNSIFSITKTAQTAEDGEDHVSWSKNNVSAAMHAEHRQFWNDVLDHVNKL